jgi:membrane protein required for beta-lactamase induction
MEQTTFWMCLLSAYAFVSIIFMIMLKHVFKGILYASLVLVICMLVVTMFIGSNSSIKVSFPGIMPWNFGIATPI